MENELQKLKKDRKQAEVDFERLKEQIIGVQYIMKYLDGRIQEIENPDKKDKK